MRYLVLLLLVGCVDQVDQRWELDHDHVVAVRATPPAIMPGERARIDALLAHANAAPTVSSPLGAAVDVAEADPRYGIISATSDGWYVNAPSDEVLAQIRAREGLAGDAPVPVPVVMAFPSPTEGEYLYATKTVYLGAQGQNPVAPSMVIDGQLASDQISVPMQRDVYVSVNPDPGARVNWLTSCGSLFQDDVATAFLRVAPDDDQSGQLAVVIRDARGGVAWRVWPVTATR